MVTNITSSGQRAGDYASAADKLVAFAARMYAEAGSFHGVPVNGIVKEAGTSAGQLENVGNKEGLVARVVAGAVAELEHELDRVLPEDKSGAAAVAAGVRALFESLANGLTDEQTLVVMAWLELPTKRRKIWKHEARGRDLHPGRKAADDYDRQIVERLTAAVARGGAPAPEGLGQRLAALVRGAHLAVARGRPLDVAEYRDLASRLLTARKPG